MRVRLTRQADRDIESILRDTLAGFGTVQLNRYAEIIARGVDLLAADPDRASARRRPDIGEGVRSFHLALAASRRSAAAHHIYFLKSRDAGGNDEVVVLRILHERMEPKRRVLDSLGTDQPGR